MKTDNFLDKQRYVSIEKQITASDSWTVSKHPTINSIILHSSKAGTERRQLEKDKILRIKNDPDTMKYASASERDFVRQSEPFALSLTIRRSKNYAAPRVSFTPR